MLTFLQSGFDCARKNKCLQLFAKVGKLYAVCQTRCSSIRKILLLFKKIESLNMYLQLTRFVFILFSICNKVKFFLPRLSPPLPLTICIQSAVSVSLTRVVKFMILPSDSSSESERNVKNLSEIITKKSCKIVALDEKVKILVKIYLPVDI